MGRERNINVILSRWAAGLALASLGGCTAEANSILFADGMDWRQPGILQMEKAGVRPVPTRSAEVDRIRWDSEPSNDVITPPRVIEVSALVAVAEPFDVTVYTIARSGCWSADGQEIRISERTIEIRPYDRHSGAELCTTILGYLPHRTQLTLNQSGEWLIRVIGRRARYGDGEWYAPVGAETTIVAQ